MPVRLARTRAPILGWFCGAVLSTAGCASHHPTQATPGHSPAEEGDAKATWPFWPRRMVIYPLSQFATERSTGQLLIEAHVEFLDEFGHTCKAVGLMSFSLYDAAGTKAGAAPAAQWTGTVDLDLTDPEKNRERYDPVTRTYLFKLKVGGVTLPDAAELRAEFQSADGQHFEARFLLPSTTRSVSGPSR